MFCASVACRAGGHTVGPVPPVYDKGWQLTYRKDYSADTCKVRESLATTFSRMSVYKTVFKDRASVSLSYRKNVEHIDLQQIIIYWGYLSSGLLSYAANVPHMQNHLSYPHWHESGGARGTGTHMKLTLLVMMGVTSPSSLTQESHVFFQNS